MATAQPVQPGANRQMGPLCVRCGQPARGGLARWMLLGVVAIWGGTFPVLKELVGGLSPTLVVAVRFTLASLTLLGGFWVARYGTGRARDGADIVRRARPARRLWARAGWLGLFLGLAYLCQTAGLVYTSASKAGFLTGLFVIFTPLAEWALLSRRPSLSTWGAVALVLVGLAFLSIQGNTWATLGHFGWGDVLVMASAALYGVQLALAGQWTREEDPLQLSLIEIPTVAVVAWTSVGLFSHHPLLGYGPAVSPVAALAGLNGVGWLGILYLAVLATAIALVAQLYGQRLLPATQAAVIFSLEPVFGALFSFLLLGERLSPVNLLGAAVLVASSVWVSWPSAVPSRSRVASASLHAPGIASVGQDGPELLRESAGGGNEELRSSGHSL